MAEFFFPKIYPILDTAALERRGCALVEATRAVLAGGARILQIRHKEHWSRNRFEDAEEAARLCHLHGAMPVVNDRADIAMLLNAGLHIGQDDLPVLDARRLVGEHRMLGVSTHNLAQVELAAAQPVNYVAIGPVFGTSSKANPESTVGLEQLQAWRGRVGQPVVAIGGITRENAQQVLDAGADALAIIGDLLPDVCTESTIRERMEEWHRLLNR